MSEQNIKKTRKINTGLIVGCLAVVVFGFVSYNLGNRYLDVLSNNSRPTIDPADPARPVKPANPKPETIESLAKRVRVALKEDPEKAMRYAALYQVAQGVVLDDTRTPKQIREDISGGIKKLGLETTPEFTSIVRELLEPHAGNKVHKSLWATDVKRLSEACLEAAQQ